MKSYHCCATCNHFRIRRNQGRIETICQRLGYETKSYYQFNCWDPRPDILEKMKNEGVEEKNVEAKRLEEGK
jgi:hypothetical protein